MNEALRNDLSELFQKHGYPQRMGLGMEQLISNTANFIEEQVERNTLNGPGNMQGSEIEISDEMNMPQVNETNPQVLH